MANRTVQKTQTAQTAQAEQPVDRGDEFDLPPLISPGFKASISPVHLTPPTSSVSPLPSTSTSAAMRDSVQSFPDLRTSPRLTIFQIASFADEAPAWWSPARDVYLDNFWPTEPYLAGAVFSVASRNASFRYELTGTRTRVMWAQKLFAQADFGRGWQSFMMKLVTDYLTLDNGAFMEIIRPARARLKSSGSLYDAVRIPHPDTGEHTWFVYDRTSGKVNYHLKQGADFSITDSPLDLPVGIAHLDSLRCERTGHPLYPVIYTDQDGYEHLLSNHQVVSLEEMPSPRQDMHGVQHCAVSRALRLSQTIRDMLVYKHEKIAGRFARAIHLTNIDADTIQDAVNAAHENSNNIGLMRYSQPIIAATLDPNARPDVSTIELASMPDGFDEETSMRWYIAGIAVVFGVDYGFLAPLPGNKLGTADQAETAARQAKGKSSRLFLEMMQYKFNYCGILPEDVAFKFAVPDPLEESERDRAFARRARARATQIGSGEITPEIASQMAADVGDIEPKYLEMMGLADMTPYVTVSGTEVQIPEVYHPRSAGDISVRRAPDEMGMQSRPHPARFRIPAGDDILDRGE